MQTLTRTRKAYLNNLLRTYIGVSYDEWASFGDKPVTVADIHQLLRDIQDIKNNDQSTNTAGNRAKSN